MVPYLLIDIGKIVGFDSDANAVNNAGVAVGSYNPTPENPASIGAFRYLRPSGLPLPNPNPPNWVAYGINNATPEKIVGAAGTPVVWTAGVASTLESVGTGEARDINDSGIVVGNKDIGNQLSSAFVLDTNTGQMATNLFLPGGTWSNAVAVNSQGVAVGSAEYPGQFQATQHAVRYADGVLTDLDPNGVYSAAYDINDAGIIAGVKQYDEIKRAVLFLPTGEIRPLDPFPLVVFSTAYGLTEGDAPGVVGQMDRVAGEDRAFIWFNGACYDLNALLGTVLGGGDITQYKVKRANAVAVDGNLIVGQADYTDPSGQRVGNRAVLLVK